ncbi:hypothetical protein [Bradyrhizobium sediminis]|nr:hypothetical protein [Bradyrhizobium sediminis]
MTVSPFKFDGDAGAFGSPQSALPAMLNVPQIGIRPLSLKLLLS